MKKRAIAPAIMVILTALFINLFWEEGFEIALLVPLLFLAMSVENMMKLRKSWRIAKEEIGRAVILDISSVPVKRRFGGTWMFGPLSIARSRETSSLLQEGSTSTVAFLPESGLVASMNGVPLPRAFQVVAPSAFMRDAEAMLKGQQQTMPMSTGGTAYQTVSTETDNLPPPPPPDE